MDKKLFIEELFKKRSDYNDPDQAATASNLLDTVSSDIYSESQRFVFELIQNADDAAENTNNEVHFEFFKDCLVVSHNGQPFTEEDIKSLTSAGSSTKKADSTKTGYKGIGFKSVFGKSERVTIFSDGYQFRFDKSNFKEILPWQIIPIWTELNELPSEEIQKFISTNKFKVSTIIEIDNALSLENDLKELLSDGQILLFLRRVSKISITKNGNHISLIQKERVSESDYYNEVAIFKNSKEVSSWIIKTYENIPVPINTREELKKDSKTPRKLRDAEFTEISFAAKLQKKKLSSLNEGESLIFTYLPTKVRDFKFPFLVNGSFLTNAAREGIHEDKIWNQWLFELIAEKTLDWLELLSKSTYKFQILHLLPNRFNSSHNELKRAFDRSFYNNCSQKSFIISRQESSRKVSEVILDKTGLSNQSFITAESITDYLKAERGLNLSDDCFVNPKVEEPNKLKSIGVEAFELENFEKFFISEAFTSKHSVTDNFHLIRYCKEKSDKDKQGIWFQTLKNLPFIFDENVRLYNPSNGICFPIGINSTELGEIPIIHSDVFDKIKNDQPVFNWLKKLGVKEPSQIAYVTNVIIPSLKQPNFINDDNYLQITHYLFRLYKDNLLDEEMLESLRELRIKTKSPKITFKEAQYCFLSNRFQPQLKIEELIKEVYYVSEDYLFSDSNELQWNLFFKALKVKDRVEVEIINNNNNLPTLRTLTHSEWVNKCYEKAKAIPGAFGFGEHNIIGNIRIPSFLKMVSENYDYSILFWENLIQNVHSLADLIASPKFYYGVGYGTNSYSTSVENYFTWFIKNQNCIPTSTKEILSPKDVFINHKEIKQIASNYLPVFEYSTTLPEDWRVLLPFKDKLELNDYLTILKKIAEQAEDEENKIKPSLQRIGLIYNKIAALIPDISEENKKTISDWANKNKLLCANGNFEICSELKWVTIEGFSLDSEKLKIVQLPENVHKDSENFKELITLLHIQTIDEFIPTFDNTVPENTLKQKFEQILPYFSAIIEKKNFENSITVFERLYTVLDNTDFYTANEIKLSFNYQSETFDGPTLSVYKGDGKFYYKGRWKSERTLLSLIKELSGLLCVSGLNEELRFLLLESENSEIREWLSEQGINLLKLLSPRRFTKRAEFKYEKQSPTTEESILENSKADSEVDYSYEQKDEEVEINVDIEEFIPISQPQNHDFSNVSAKIKVFSNSEGKAESNYYMIESQEVREDVGRWCEEFVFEFLIKNSKEFSDIIWINKEEESGNPFDIKYVQNGKTKYIDVKGTPSGSKDLIYLSPNEWVFMFEKAENYSIYRVYNAGNNARIEIIENPSGLLQQGKIFPNPITLQV